MTYPEAQAVFDRLSERVKKSKLGQEVYQEIQKLKNGSPGSPAAIFSKKDIDGEMFSLAEHSGENTSLSISGPVGVFPVGKVIPI